MNIELLQRVRDFIAKKPEHFNLGWFATNPFESEGEIILDDCGTTACIAGTAVLLARHGVVARNYLDWHTEAQVLLRLTDGESQSLFYAEDGSVWSRHADEFGWNLVDGEIDDWEQITAEQAVIVLDRIISGEVKL